MGKQNIGKILMMGLQRSGVEGIVPYFFAKQNHMNDEPIVDKILYWENSGKVRCVERGRTPYVSRYVLVDPSERRIA